MNALKQCLQVEITQKYNKDFASQMFESIWKTIV